MRALFTRVLLLLLGSFLVVAIISVLLFRWISHEIGPGHLRFDKFSRHIASELVWEHEHGDLERFNRRLRRRHNVESWIMDENNRPVSSRSPPADILESIESFPAIVYPLRDGSGDRGFIFAHEVRGDRQGYRVIMASLGPHEPARNRLILYSLPVFVFIVGLLSASVLLGYWVLRPVSEIRKSTGALSEDNLEVKVPDTITRRNDAFGELGREFNRMTERVSRTVSNQNQLLRDVSHELRSPLARIQVAASLSEQKTGRSSELVRIQDEVERLNNLIEDLLTLSRLKNEGRVNMSKIDLMQLVGALVEDANYEFQQHRRQAVLSGPGRLRIVGHRELLSGMYENVIRNGLRYTPDGESLKVECRLDGKWAVVSISDNGPGVDDADIERIFEPFFRADKARDTSSGHHGIGLALSKTIADIHGGRIHAKNTPSAGLCVTIEIPRSTAGDG
ncbi:MAG: HAMP domain-containing protein [Gammaproteobacteria bacterium]|nr:HAMP domain-containing protein [Gammaproteobacteria bacterium]